MTNVMIRLTVYRKDKPPMSGVYDWTGALLRLDFARTLPDYLDFEFGAP